MQPFELHAIIASNNGRLFRQILYFKIMRGAIKIKVRPFISVIASVFCRFVAKRSSYKSLIYGRTCPKFLCTMNQSRIVLS